MKKGTVEKKGTATIQERTFLSSRSSTPVIFNTKEYYRDLGTVQPACSYVDIFTITGMMNTEQKIAHILHYAIAANRPDIIRKWS